MYYDDEEYIIDKPGLFLHLVQQHGYRTIEYFPPKYQPIFNLTCDVYCHHKEDDIYEMESCHECSATIDEENFYKDTFMEQFKSPVRIDLVDKMFVLIPVGKKGHEWEPLKNWP